MGYQESLVRISPKSNFDKLIETCKAMQNNGFYDDLFSLEIGSVVEFKQSVGKIPAGEKALWVTGERSSHNNRGLFETNKQVGFNKNKITFTPIESVVVNRKIVENIDFSDDDKISENNFIKRCSFEKYVSDNNISGKLYDNKTIKKSATTRPPILKYSEEQINIARQVDLVEYLQYRGIELKKTGSVYCMKEHDSFVVRQNNKWYWNSQNIGGVSAIDYLQKVENMNFKNAVKTLLEYENVSIQPNFFNIHNIKKTETIISEKNKEFKLPKKNINNKRMFAYLVKTRGLDSKIVSELFKNKQIYESDKHNVIFVGKDKENIPKYASQRGTYTEKPFKGDCYGSDKRYGFEIKGNSNKVYVFEAPIDTISFASLEKMHNIDHHKHTKLSLGGVSDVALEQYLKDNPQITKICFCLDNDNAGNNAGKEYIEKYRTKGYEVSRKIPLNGNDYNESLVNLRESIIEVTDKNIDKTLEKFIEQVKDIKIPINR